MAATRLSEAAKSAPRKPGVYFLLGRGGVLIYVGKAADLRRRLGDHARNGLRAVPPGAVHTVRWEECDDEEDAFAREADLIVMLRPPANASHADQDRDCYVAAARDATHVSFTLGAALDGSARVYGTLPHLAKGSFSHTAKRTKAGYTALLRLLWVERDARIPARIGGASPPMHHDASVAAELDAPLHDLLSGRSARLLGALGNADVPEFMRPALRRDLVAARAFFDLGPRRLRHFRLRHGLPPGPVTGDAMAGLLAREVRQTIGDDSE